MSALFGPLGGTSAPGRAIANAVDALDAALRPWKRAGMHAWEKGLAHGLSDEDVVLAQAPMDTLEGAELDELNEVIDKVSGLIHDICAMPNACAPPSFPALRTRAASLRTKIDQDFLQVAITKEAELFADASPEEQTASMLKEWAEVIDVCLLSNGMKEKDTTYGKVTRVLTNLENMENVPSSALKESSMTTTLAAVVTAACVPSTGRMPGLRARAQGLLQRWATLPTVQALEASARSELWLDGLVLKHPLHEPRHELYFDALLCIDALVQVLRQLEAQAASGNVSGVRQYLDEAERYKNLPSDLKQQLYAPAQKAQAHLQAVTTRLSAKDKGILTRLQAFEQDCMQNSPPPRTAAAWLSYDTRTPAASSAMKICFKHATHILDSSNMVATWADVVVESHPETPLQRVFDRFISVANEKNRHPAVPYSGFRFAVADAALNSHEPSRNVWETNSTHFAQGRVADLGLDGATPVVYYLHANYQDNQPISLPDVHLRKLSEACRIPPNNWVTPHAPSQEDGSADAWNEIPTLAFIGNGTDVWPYMSYPPVIAARVYTLPLSANAVLGLQVFEKPLQQHIATPRGCVLAKLQPPLTEAQARALLGRTIQYEDPRALNPLGMPGQPYVEPPKKKRRVVDGVDWTRVYTGVVWGFDPERMELKIFGGWKLGETCRTLMVGEPQELVPPPWLFPEERVAFAPRWLGKVALPVPEPPPSAPEPEQPPTQQHQPSRLAQIQQLAPIEFEVGIGGDQILLVGEISVHGADALQITSVDKCKPGIWASGWKRSEDNPAVLCWVHWIREGSIDLAQPVSAFANGRGPLPQLPRDLVWTQAGSVDVDGGSVAIMARGIAHPDSQVALTGEGAEDEDDFLRDLALIGWEDDLGHVPGGVSVITGGDGSFEVEITRDGESRVIAVRVKGMQEG